MKAILVLCIAFAIAYPTEALFLDTIQNAVSSVSNSVNNVVSNVVTTTQNTIGTIQNGVQTAQLIGNILWDNAFGPSWDLFLSGGADFIDNYFGSILNGIGKKRESEVRLQLAVVQQVFQQQAGQLVTKFKSLLNQFVAESLQIFSNSIFAIVLGQTTINDVFGVILGKFKGYINQAVQYAINTVTTSLAGLGPETAQAVAFVQQQLQTAGVVFENELNQISSFAINAVNGLLALVYNNFEDLIDYLKAQVASFIAEANQILAASLIGLLFGTTNVDNLLTAIVEKGKQYLMVTVGYAVEYFSQKLFALYTQYKPLIDQAGAFLQQFNLPTAISQLQQFVQQIALGASGLFPGVLPPFETINQLLG